MMWHKIGHIPKENFESFLQQHVQNWNFSLALEYESHFENTPKIRALLYTLFTMYSVNTKDSNRLVLVSDELNNNAIEHGVWSCWVNTIHIEILKESNGLHVRIEVEDCWIGTSSHMQNLQKEYIKNTSTKHRGIRWRWLFLITETIADSLYFKDCKPCGLLVWITKQVSTEQ